MTQTQPDDLLQLKCIDYVELYVSNPLQAAHFYRTVLGFNIVAYAGLETQVREQTSYLVVQGDIRLLLTGPLDGSSPIAEHVKKHGDGVKDIAFAVKDIDEAFQTAVTGGAEPLLEPTMLEDDYGQVRKATIAAFNDTVHSFVQRVDYEGVFLPKFEDVSGTWPTQSAGLKGIDHVAVGMEPGQLDEWVEFYQRVLSFHEMHEEMVTTEISSMNSKVVADPTGLIKFPIVEPVPTGRRSQIEEYLAYYNGPGAQHIALLTDDIIGSVHTLRQMGLQFLRTPGPYYDMLKDRVGPVEDTKVSRMRELGILMDKDDWGRLSQIFTKPVQSRPTMFLELIERDGARGFGAGNIKALFEAVEREQVLRGNI